MSESAPRASERADAVAGHDLRLRPKGKLSRLASWQSYVPPPPPSRSAPTSRRMASISLDRKSLRSSDLLPADAQDLSRNRRIVVQRESDEILERLGRGHPTVGGHEDERVSLIDCDRYAVENLLSAVGNCDPSRLGKLPDRGRSATYNGGDLKNGPAVVKQLEDARCEGSTFFFALRSARPRGDLGQASFLAILRRQGVQRRALCF